MNESDAISGGDDDPSQPSASVAPLSVTAVSLTLPPLWPNDPLVIELMFAQIEVQFHTRDMASQAIPFSYVISFLKPEYAQKVCDILLHLSTDQSYDHLKVELIKRTSVSKQKCFHQLLISQALGDRKPS